VSCSPPNDHFGDCSSYLFFDLEQQVGLVIYRRISRETSPSDPSLGGGGSFPKALVVVVVVVVVVVDAFTIHLLIHQ
jgi:hypothetical protein